MTLPALATVDQLEVRTPGGLTDFARAQAALDDASAMVRSVAGKTWTTDGDLDADIPGIVAVVVCTVARRILANPDGVTQEGIDDYTFSVANASPDVYLTRGERQAIRSAAGRSGVWSMQTTRVGTGDDTQYVDVVGQDEPIPFLPGGY